MFPIVHYFANIVAYGEVSPLMALGGLFPDLASGAGLDRNEAHQMGAAFHHWCEKNAAGALDLARGIISHGVQPHGVDYYADEFWPGSTRGWCFEQGRPWIERIAAVTRLPQSLWLWKAHNFVEMSYELITIERLPQIGAKLLAAVNDKPLVEEAAAWLARYSGRESALISEMFHKAPQIFALEEVTARTLAERQEASYRRRHNVYDADIGGMTALLEELHERLRESYDYFMEQANPQVSEMLANY